MLIGQNPGAEEDKTGRPFVGRSGRYLNEVLRKNGIDCESLFITSMLSNMWLQMKQAPKARWSMRLYALPGFVRWT